MSRMLFLLIFTSLMTVCRCAFTDPPSLDPTYRTKPTLNSKANPAQNPKWIWAAKTSLIQTVYFRKTLFLKKTPKTAALYLSVDDNFFLHVNGYRSGMSRDEVFTSRWMGVRRFTLDKKLHRGSNLIAVEGFNSSGAAGLIARVEVDGAPVAVSDSSWLVAEGQCAESWSKPTFDDSKWSRATEVAPYGGGVWGEALIGLPESQEQFEHLEILPKSIKFENIGATISGADSLLKPKGIVAVAFVKVGLRYKPFLFLDFGKEIAGRLLICGTKGEPISVDTGESVEECLSPHKRSPCSGTFCMKLQGEIPVATQYSAFRFAKISFNGVKPLEVTRIVCDHKYYPVQYRGSFNCSDPLLNQIWYTGAYTAHLCMQEEIWDAPKRDRGLWAGDLQVTGQTINTVFAETKLMERSIVRLRDRAQFGNPPDTLPIKDINSIPGYSASWFCTLADYHRHIGKYDFLKKQHRKILSLLAYQRTKFDKNDLLPVESKDWRFVDWARGFVGKSVECRVATNLHLIYGVREAIYLLKELGDISNAKLYETWLNTLTRAARGAYRDSKTGTFGDRIQTNCMAILSGVANKADYPSIYSCVLQPSSPAWKPQPSKTLDEIAITPYHGYFVLQTLARMDRQLEASEFMRKYWGAMLHRGATTFWEKFDLSFPENYDRVLEKMHDLSSCHGWSTGPVSYMSERILGVRTTGAGFKSATIQPELGQLKWAEGDVPTPRGQLHIRVERRNRGARAKITLPAGIRATILMNGKTVTIDKAGVYSFQQ